MKNSRPVPPPKGPLIVRQGGCSVKIPLPIVLVDSNEQRPYTFESYPKWIGGTLRQKLRTGDYSILGFENEVSLERKQLSDLVVTLTHNRATFLRECERLAHFRRKAIVIEASLAEVKTPYKYADAAHPNSIVGSLDAIRERWHIEILYCCNRDLAEERCASILSKYHALRWLEENGYARQYIDGDI